MSSNPAVASASTAETEFKTKTFFTRALMLSKFIQIGINKPKTWLKNGLKFLSNQLMFIAVGICAVIGVASIIIQFGKQEIPLTFFTEYKVEIFGRVQCCAKNHCHNVSRIGVDLLDDNIFYQDSYLDDTITDKNGSFHFLVKSKQLGKMRPYLQVFHICNTGGISSASYQSYRISWYRIPPHHIVESSDNHPYYIYPLSLNGEGFIESVWSHCPFVDCMKELDEADERRYLEILHNIGGYTT